MFNVYSEELNEALQGKDGVKLEENVWGITILYGDKAGLP